MLQGTLATDMQFALFETKIIDLEKYYLLEKNINQQLFHRTCRPVTLESSA